MWIRRVVSLLFLSVVTGAVGLAREDATEPIPNWPAPPFWRLSSAPRTGQGSPRRETTLAGVRPLRIETESSPAPFVAVTPCRIIDTMMSGGAFTAGETRTYQMSGGTLPCVGGFPSTLVAVSLNITVTQTGGTGFVTAYPTGTALPDVTTITWVGTNQTLSNAAVVPTGTLASINVYASAATHLMLDVNGYYAGGVVTSLNETTGEVTIGGAGSVSVETVGNTITVTGPASLPPSGTAGGSLTGSYPNPSLAIGAVSASHIAAGQVVKSINTTAQDHVTIAGSGGTTVSTEGSTITVATPGFVPSGGFLLGRPGDTTLIGAGYAEVAQNVQDFWTATSTTGAPTGRYSHTAVWTGTKMIVWGGFDGVNSFNTGGQYDPVGDSWTATTTTMAPTGRYLHTAVWTGTKMIVWGGFDGTNSFNNGGQYDPVGDSWTATTTGGAPTVRYYHAAVWTGTKMIVWGGFNGSYLSTGGQYDSVGDSWTATTTTMAPIGRLDHRAVWTGTKMIVWGGYNGSYLNTGGQYDPVGDSWTATTTTMAPTGRRYHTAVWTGTKMIVWGGAPYTSVGGRYDPVGDSWTATSTDGAPAPRNAHTAVWTGTKMIVWGGNTVAGVFNNGGQYDSVRDSWSATTTAGPPTGSYFHTAVWTGTKMIVWGGSDNLSGTSSLNTGGQYSLLSLYVKN